MINKMEIAGVHTNIDDDLTKYIQKKIGKLDNYIPRHARKSAHIEVKLKETKIKAKKQCSCEIVLYLPHETLNSKETTINMFAAVDIVETKLKNQIKKYKEMHTKLRIHRRVLAKFHRRTA